MACLYKSNALSTKEQSKSDQIGTNATDQEGILDEIRPQFIGVEQSNTGATHVALGLLMLNGGCMGAGGPFAMTTS
jgi:hypothetical protein